MANNSKIGNMNVGASQINIYDNCLIINCCWNKNFTDLKLLHSSRWWFSVSVGLVS